MKKVLLSAFLLVGMGAFADHPDHIQAKGEAFFKAGRGGLTRSPMNMYVPKNHKGKFILEVGGKEVEAKRVIASKAAGRTVVDMVFLNVPGTAKGTAALLHGTVILDKKSSVYYGDFYTRKMTRVATTAAGKCDCCKDGTCGDDCTCTEDACDPDCPCCDCDDECDATSVAAGTCDTDCCKDCDCKDCDCDKGGCKDCDKDGCDGCKGGCKPPKKGHPGKHHHRGHKGHDHRGWTFGGGFSFATVPTQIAPPPPSK